MTEHILYHQHVTTFKSSIGFQYKEENGWQNCFRVKCLIMYFLKTPNGLFIEWSGLEVSEMFWKNLTCYIIIWNNLEVSRKILWSRNLHRAVHICTALWHICLSLRQFCLKSSHWLNLKTSKHTHKGQTNISTSLVTSAKATLVSTISTRAPEVCFCAQSMK